MTPTPLTLLLIVSSNFVYAYFQFKEAIQVLHAYVISRKLVMLRVGHAELF